MIEFIWNYRNSKKGLSYIEWTSKWDGRWDNDPLLSESDKSNEPYTVFSHPFEQTVDYEQAADMYKH